jgi:sec-independent protein translocase protein TatC
MSLADHFREFRNRLVKSALAVLLGSVVGWVVYDRLVADIRNPITKYIAEHPDRANDIKPVLTGLMSGFSLHLSVAIATGVVVSAPIWLYQVWAFVVPGLTGREKRISLAFIGAATPLFLLGIFLAHYSLPLVVGVLLDFTPAGTANFPDLSNYINFVLRFSLGFGFAFLLPVFLVALNFIGLLPTTAMIKSWRPAVFLIFVFSAMMMPTPDPFSMMILALPLTFFYFCSIGIGRLFDRRRERDRPDWLDVADDETSTL